MSAPKITKYKKYHKRKLTKCFGSELQHQVSGDNFFIKALEPGRISARHLEAMRRTARKSLKRTGKLWVVPFPQTPVTAKPAEVRMGKGKGSVAYWAAHIPAGTPLLCLSGVNLKAALKALNAAKQKIPLLTRIS